MYIVKITVILLFSTPNGIDKIMCACKAAYQSTQSTWEWVLTTESSWELRMGVLTTQYVHCELWIRAYHPIRMGNGHGHWPGSSSSSSAPNAFPWELLVPTSNNQQPPSISKGYWPLTTQFHWECYKHLPTTHHPLVIGAQLSFEEFRSDQPIPLVETLLAAVWWCTMVYHLHPIPFSSTAVICCGSSSNQ